MIIPHIITIAMYDSNPHHVNIYPAAHAQLGLIDPNCVSRVSDYLTLYHGCCMLTNQIAQLEVGNFHKHLPRGGYFLPKAMLIMFYSFRATVQVGYIGVSFYLIDTT